MSQPEMARAKLYRVTGNGKQQGPAADDANALTVQFNPTSLSYSVQNTLQKPDGKPNGKPRASQFVAQTTAKLEFDLVFDSTHNGHDVREQTARIKELLAPGKKPQEAAPPLVGFRWGAFHFKGFIEQFREQLDFFSSDGVPLRSTVKLSMSAQDADAVFNDDKFSEKPQDTRLASVPAGGTSKMASDAGNPGAGRALAAANGFESMRNPGAALAAVAGGGVQLKAAAAFSAGAGAGFGGAASAGFGGVAGASFGSAPGAAFGASAGATFGTASVTGFAAAAQPGFVAGAAVVPFGAAVAGGRASFGGTSSAGLPAAYGAFAGLGPSRTATHVVLDTRAFETRTVTPLVAADFAVGGRAIARASAGLTSDVGATARIRFD